MAALNRIRHHRRWPRKPQSSRSSRGVVLADSAASWQLLEERDRTVEAQQLEIERLKVQLARLRRWKFGRSSEQLDLAITQIELTLDALQAVTPEATTATAATAAVRAPVPRRHRPVRRALPAHLPRETLVHQSPEIGRAHV